MRYALGRPLLLLGTLLLAACGRGGGGGSATTPPRPTSAAGAPTAVVKPITLDPQANFLTKLEVLNATERQAVCNDGSPAVYYFRPGQNLGVDKWIVFLEGGGACSAESDCLARAKSDPGRVSSKNYADKREAEGLFLNSPERNPVFGEFNHVHVKYCSSDTFLQDRERVFGDQVWQFRGAQIVPAVFEDLANPALFPDHNLSNATDILFAGGSAGAFGAQNHLDDVAAQFPNANVKGILDSSWKPPAPPYSAEAVTIMQGIDLATFDPTILMGDENNPSSEMAPDSGLETLHVDASCAANPPTGRKNLCTFAYFLYPFIETPVFIYTDQRDEHMLEGKGIPKQGRDANHKAYVEEYMRLSRATYAQTNVTALFAPAVGNHTALVHTDRFFTTKINGVTVAEALLQWYTGEREAFQLIAMP
jgi:hypothetical protein